MFPLMNETNNPNQAAKAAGEKVMKSITSHEVLNAKAVAYITEYLKKHLTVTVDQVLDLKWEPTAIMNVKIDYTLANGGSITAEAIFATAQETAAVKNMFNTEAAKYVGRYGYRSHVGKMEQDSCVTNALRYTASVNDHAELCSLFSAVKWETVLLKIAEKAQALANTVFASKTVVVDWTSGAESWRNSITFQLSNEANTRDVWIERGDSQLKHLIIGSYGNKKMFPVKADGTYSWDKVANAVVQKIVDQLAGESRRAAEAVANKKQDARIKAFHAAFNGKYDGLYVSQYSDTKLTINLTNLPTELATKVLDFCAANGLCDIKTKTPVRGSALPKVPAVADVTGM